jgi:hypothetical protein
MKITTQLHINRLHIRANKTHLNDTLMSNNNSNFEFQVKNGIIKVLPFCILDIIKSFLFYDIKTYKIMQDTKLNKGKMLYIINNIDLSRANNFDDHPYYSDNEEHWSFGGYLDEKIALQAENCYYCGNYINHSKDPTLFSDDIYCKCDIEDEILSYINSLFID